jgi:hypothetical protein
MPEIKGNNNYMKVIEKYACLDFMLTATKEKIHHKCTMAVQRQ